MTVTGPGLGDLLTAGPQEAVFDLERTPGPLEERLERIEAMLSQLVPNTGATHATNGQRISTSTYVDDGTMHGKANNGTHGDAFAQPSADPTATTNTTGFNRGSAHANGTFVPTGEQPHQHGHTPFVDGVAGAGDRPHVDARRV